MTKTYTASDFANARFAEHEDGELAVRLERGWATVDEITGDTGWTPDDQCMARDRWVPVAEKPTLTKSEFDKAVESATIAPSVIAPFAFAAALGIEIIPDPEPTNTERLEAILLESENHFNGEISPHHDVYAKWLNDRGVTAPNVKDN